MAYISFDPRRVIRTKITADADLFQSGVNQRVITVTDSNNNSYQIPIYLTEESKSDELKPLPLIEFGLLISNPVPQDIRASTRKYEARIDIHVYWTKMDNIEQDIFGLLIADKLYDLVRINQCGTIPGTHFINITNSGTVQTERNAKQVVYHRVMEMYVLWYDRP